MDEVGGLFQCVEHQVAHRGIFVLLRIGGEQGAFGLAGSFAVEGFAATCAQLLFCSVQ